VAAQVAPRHHLRRATSSTRCWPVGEAQRGRRRAAAAGRNPSRRGRRRRERENRWAELVAWRSRSAGSHSSKVYSGDRSGQASPEPAQAAATLGVEEVRGERGRARKANRKEGEVDDNEEAQSPISQAPERPGSGRGRAAAGRRHGGFREVRV
jgi:hypothetical protein